ncbi:restriction endonuclease type II-like protein [Vibrio phage 1.081.O._10N.286.52.C2]|nr:restriction endonuclease type II-like protein [Vibrio phage 1.081.O._10N.286.52.C2]
MAKKTTEQWVADAIAKHGDKFDYSQVEYTRWDAKVKVGCPDCNEFFLTPAYNHIKGSGCNICSTRNNARSKIVTEEKFIERAIAVHGNYYDYSHMGYTSFTEKVIIGCPLHGDFEVIPHSHLSHGCSKCANDKTRISVDDWKAGAAERHNSEYTYDNVSFEYATDMVSVTCKVHGDFQVRASDHKNDGVGCVRCFKSRSRSKIEIDLFEFVKNICPDAEYSNRDILGGRELDIYIPSAKLAIEYDGTYWHSSASKSDDYRMSKYHIEKTERCADLGIRLIHIFDTDNMKSVKAFLSSILKSPSRVLHARNCTVDKISSNIFREFCDEYHLQGKCNATHMYGLYHAGELVSVMSFNKPRSTNYAWELNRYCVKSDVRINGGASKLLRAFRRGYDGVIVSYANRRWSVGGVYDALQFKLSHIAPPTYWYLKGNRLFHKGGFKRSDIKRKMHFNDELTESENMYMNNYRRIWDCGLLVYVLE